MIKFEVCKQCGDNKPVANSRGICIDCVYKNNHNGMSRYEVSFSKKKKTNDNRSNMLKRDKLFYLLCFRNKKQICEECGKKLPPVFEDENGIVAIYRYSHILPKSTYPRLRHNLDNINILCFDCHYRWDFGDKKKMKIYESNLLTIDKLTDEK